MKRVLFIDLAIDKMGGAERVISTLAGALSGSYRVDVCSVYKYSSQPFYGYPAEVRRRYLIDLSRLPSTRSRSGASFVFFRSFEKAVELTFYNKRIRQYCDTELGKYAAVIFGRTMAAVDFLPHMSAYRGKVIVRDATHLYDTFKRNQRMMKNYFPDRVYAFIVSSEESIRAYRKFFGSGAMSIRKIYNPLGIIPRTAHHVECRQITGVGRYSKEKGFETLIRAFAIVHSKYPDWTLALLGAGRALAGYQGLCRKLGILQSVEFRKSTDIVEEYCRTGIYVMTSRHEGYANALVEALACGVPSVSFDWYMGAGDIIQDGKTGCIVRLNDRGRYYRGANDAGDVRNLASKILYLIENPEVRERMSENAVGIRESRNLEKITREWAELIEE